ncbi:hypothetical protein C8A06_0275 [Microbacteriaceae bacterium MWH-Ta3]|nr:hypothetical protein C8A06_0275 [Microbacteriaceae bacterium MWH-Ta3]
MTAIVNVEAYWFTVVGYWVIIAIAVMVEFVARRRPEFIAPLFDMLDHVMHTRMARIGLIAAWWWFGWHFFVGPTL